MKKRIFLGIIVVVLLCWVSAHAETLPEYMGISGKDDGNWELLHICKIVRSQNLIIDGVPLEEKKTCPSFNKSFKLIYNLPIPPQPGYVLLIQMEWVQDKDFGGQGKVPLNLFLLGEGVKLLFKKIDSSNYAIIPVDVLESGFYLLAINDKNSPRCYGFNIE